MKKQNYISIILFAIILVNSLTNLTTAQCVQGQDIVSTDPNNPKNVQKPAFENNFDWTYNRNVNTFLPQDYGQLPNLPLQMALPFYGDDNYLAHVNYAYFTNHAERLPENLDMHPEDGWELISRHFGYELDETTQISLATRRRPSPYFILYNKYTGLFRVFVSFKLGHQQSMETRLSFQDPSQGTGLHYSALLGHYGETSQPLDVASSEDVITRLSEYGGDREWTVADFSVAYDPCVCNFDSRLLIEFASFTTASVSLSGRLIATSIPLDGVGADDGLINGDDFLLAVKRDGFQSKGGMQTYHNINALINKYKTPLSASGGPTTLDDIILGQLQKLWEKQKGSVDKQANKVINTHTTQLLNDFIDFGNSDILDFVTGKSVLGLKYGVAAKASKYLLSSITPSDNTRPPIPNVSFIEGEIELAGTVETVIDYQAGDIKLHNPGSPQANSLTDWLNYPSYNEALGLFAMVETPKVLPYKYEYEGVISKEWISETPAGLDWVEVVVDYPRNAGNLRVDKGHQFVLDGGLKYTFNPAAQVNVAKTTIHAAWVLKSTVLADSVGDFMKVETGQNPAPAIREFTTDYFPIACLNNPQLGAVWRLKSSESVTIEHPAHVQDPYHEQVTLTADVPTYIVPHYLDLRLKVMINYEFLPNAQGKVHHSHNTLTYPVDVGDAVNGVFYPNYNDVSPQIHSFDQLRFEQFEEYPSLVIIDSDKTYTSNQTIEARDQIIITADLATAAGVHVIIKAAEIDVLAGAQISPNIELIPQSPIACGAPITPMSYSAVQDFCNSEKYKAKDVAFKISPDTKDEGSLPTVEEKAELLSFQIFPNPATNRAFVRTYIPDQEGATLTLRTLKGETVSTQIIKGGNQQEEIDLSNVSKGIYLVTFQTAYKVITKKLVLLQ